MNYTIIKSTKQYDEYCERLTKLDSKRPSKATVNEMEVLELLINKWEKEQFSHAKMNPIQLIEHLMDVHQLSRTDMLQVMGIKRSALSQILSYQKGVSKAVVRKLADRFRLAEEAFSRPYPLKISTSLKSRSSKSKPRRRNTSAAA